MIIIPIVISGVSDTHSKISTRNIIGPSITFKRNHSAAPEPKKMAIPTKTNKFLRVLSILSTISNSCLLINHLARAVNPNILRLLVVGGDDLEPLRPLLSGYII